MVRDMEGTQRQVARCQEQSKEDLEETWGFKCHGDQNFNPGVPKWTNRLVGGV